jgi:hypothetical protein
MYLHELIKTNNWLSVSMTLISLYPDQQDGLPAYEKVYLKLQGLMPVESYIEIVLQQCYDDESGEVLYVDVSGRRNENKDQLLTESLAIEFVPWNKWLGMVISEDTLKNFNQLEIISHCLYEMTFAGYDEKEIQRQFSAIRSTVEEYKNMSEEERRKNTKTLDDFRRELNGE